MEGRFVELMDQLDAAAKADAEALKPGSRWVRLQDGSVPVTWPHEVTIQRAYLVVQDGVQVECVSSQGVELKFSEGIFLMAYVPAPPKTRHQLLMEDDDAFELPSD